MMGRRSWRSEFRPWGCTTFGFTGGVGWRAGNSSIVCPCCVRYTPYSAGERPAFLATGHGGGGNSTPSPLVGNASRRRHCGGDTLACGGSGRFAPCNVHRKSIVETSSSGTVCFRNGTIGPPCVRRCEPKARRARPFITHTWWWCGTERCGGGGDSGTLAIATADPWRPW